MILVGVDFGYTDSTTVVIVDTEATGDKFKFHSIRRETEFHDVVIKVVELMKKYDVMPENLSVPREPAFKQAVVRYFPTSGAKNVRIEK